MQTCSPRSVDTLPPERGEHKPHTPVETMRHEPEGLPLEDPQSLPIAYSADVASQHGEYENNIEASVVHELSRACKITSWTFENISHILEEQVDALQRKSDQLLAISEFHEMVRDRQNE